VYLTRQFQKERGRKTGQTVQKRMGHFASSLYAGSGVREKKKRTEKTCCTSPFGNKKSVDEKVKEKHAVRLKRGKKRCWRRKREPLVAYGGKGVLCVLS